MHVYLSNKSNLIPNYCINSSLLSGQRSSPQIWMKALQHLQIEENSSQYNVHSPYANPFALRGR